MDEMQIKKKGRINAREGERQKRRKGTLTAQ
jgi:hypothetical protein